MRIVLSHSNLGKLLHWPIDDRTYVGQRIAGSTIYGVDLPGGKLVVQEKHHPHYGISHRQVGFKKQLCLNVQEQTPGFRMVILLTGEINIRHDDGKNLQLKSGDCFLTAEQDYILQTSDYSKATLIVLYIEALRNYITENPIANQLNIVRQLSAEMNQHLDHILNHNIDTGLRDFHYANTIQQATFSYLSQAGSHQLNGCNKSYLPQVLEVARIISEDLQTRYTALQLSRKVGVNERTLDNEFVAHFKKSMFEYGTDKRMEYAKIRLETTRLTVWEIALECGYNVCAFIRVFEKLNEMTPLDWRHHKNKKP